MGNRDRMVERVYGRLEPAALARLIAKATGSTSANAQQTERESVDLVDRLDARRSASSSGVAPRAGFEPATHGLTVPETHSGPRPPRTRELFGRSAPIRITHHEGGSCRIAA